MSSASDSGKEERPFETSRPLAETDGQQSMQPARKVRKKKKEVHREKRQNARAQTEVNDLHCEEVSKPAQLCYWDNMVL